MLLLPARFVLFLLLVVAAFGTLAAEAQTLNTKIAKLFVFARHGARSPEKDNFGFNGSISCCDKTAWNKAWPMGEGNLTEIGADLHQELGRFIRSSYGDQPALPSDINPKTVSLIADPDCARCIYSLLNNTVGVFPRASNPPTFNSVQINAFYWEQYKTGTTCNILLNNSRANVLSPWFTSQSAKWAPLLNYTCANSTSDCSNYTNYNLTQWSVTAVDDQMCSYYYASYNGTGVGSILPSWFNSTIFANLYDAGWTSSYWVRYFNSKNGAFPQGARLLAGNYFQLLGLAMSNNASWAQGTGNNSNFTFPDGLSPIDTTYSINLGHDDNVAQLLTGLGAYDKYNYTDPPFASAMIFELHENTANASQKFVRTGFRHWFWNETTPKLDYLIPVFCPNVFCPVETFVAYLRDNLYVGNVQAFTAYCAEQPVPTPVPGSGVKMLPAWISWVAVAIVALWVQIVV